MFVPLASFASISLAIASKRLTIDLGDLVQVVHLWDVKFSNESICEDLRGFRVFCVSGGPSRPWWKCEAARKEDSQAIFFR